MLKDRPETKIFSPTYELVTEKLYFTVKEITTNLKSFIEETYSILWIEGEITNLRHSQNGNVYFNLTEEDATLKAIIFKNQKDENIVPFLSDGIKVLCLGKLSFYPKTGECFFIVRRVEPLGRGLLLLKKEQLIKKYKHLFVSQEKKPLPLFPKKIALITSLFGAAIKDFLKIAQQRWNLEILIYPVRVQGEGAENEIIQAVKDINTYFPDVEIIVITRGGGSFEDLAPFYTEEIILGLSQSKIPIVSAVGHEIDYTLCDLIADKRAPTPSAAAQEILPSRDEIFYKLDSYRKKLTKQIQIKLSLWEKNIFQIKSQLEQNNPLVILHKLKEKIHTFQYILNTRINHLLFVKEKKLIDFKNQIKFYHPEKRILKLQESIESLKSRLTLSINNLIQQKVSQVKYYRKLLSSLSPLNILERGYSIVKIYPKGKIVKSSSEVKNGDILEILVAKGKIWAEVKNKE